MLRMPFSFFLLTAAALAQTSTPAPADTLQALLAEVHQLRLDLQATTVTAQRVQILLYRVQLQQQSTSRAAARAQDCRDKLTDAQRNRARAAQSLQQSQDLVNSATDPTMIKQLQFQIKEEKQTLEIWQNDEQQWQGKDVEAQSQLRAEQARLDQLRIRSTGSTRHWRTWPNSRGFARARSEWRLSAAANQTQQKKTAAEQQQRYRFGSAELRGVCGRSDNDCT